MNASQGLVGNTAASMLGGSYLPHRLEQAVDLKGNPASVFRYLDDFEQLGAHMMRASWMMAGSRMHYEFDEQHGRQAGAQVRLRGSFLGMTLTIDEEVVEQIAPLRKAWQTTGTPRMLILSAYRMGFALTPRDSGCRLQVFIEYAYPRRAPTRWLGLAVGTWYARWCVNSMITEARRRFGVTRDSPAERTLRI